MTYFLENINAETNRAVVSQWLELEVSDVINTQSIIQEVYFL